jgi:hypothetical protein
MLNKSTDTFSVGFSIRVYKLLLSAYPTKFQQEYGSHMVQVFGDCCLRTIRQGGRNGMARLWAVTLLDFIQSVVSEHVQREIEMKKEMKPEDIRKAGWMLMLGAPAFILGMYWETSVYDLWIVGFPLLLISIFMLAYGSKGLQARYGEEVGGVGTNVLRLGRILGLVTSLVGFIMAWFVQWMFIFIYTGPAIILACLTLFGLAALLKKPFLSWKALIVFAGIWYPVHFVYYQLDGLIRREWITYTFTSSDLIIMAVPGIAMVVLGYILQANASQEMATA